MSIPRCCLSKTLNFSTSALAGADLRSFWGAAPIHWALLHGCKTTGITLQTLHPSHFDRGKILAQTALPGLDIPNPDTIKAPELSAFLAPKAAELLVKGLRNRVYLSDTQAKAGPILERQAPKISSEDRHINWSSWSAEEILRRHRIIGPLWNNGATGSPPNWVKRRIIWSSGFHLASPGFDHIEPGMARISGSDPCLYVQTADKQTLCAEHATVEGQEIKAASYAVKKSDMVDLRSMFMVGSSQSMRFWSPLS